MMLNHILVNWKDKPWLEKNLNEDEVKTQILKHVKDNNRYIIDEIKAYHYPEYLYHNNVEIEMFNEINVVDSNIGNVKTANDYFFQAILQVRFNNEIEVTITDKKSIKEFDDSLFTGEYDVKVEENEIEFVAIVKLIILPNGDINYRVQRVFLVV
jgi:hypothetical protein